MLTGRAVLCSYLDPDTQTSAWRSIPMMSSEVKRFFDMAGLLLETGPLLLYHWTNSRGAGHLTPVSQHRVTADSGRIASSLQAKGGISPVPGYLAEPYRMDFGNDSAAECPRHFREPLGPIPACAENHRCGPACRPCQPLCDSPGSQRLALWKKPLAHDIHECCIESRCR
jgi:hypothetical protein